MIRIVFFASVREALGSAGIEVDHEQGDTVSAVLQRLAKRDAIWQETLCAENILVALNQELVGPDTLIADGDEVAFFPPVTGG